MNADDIDRITAIVGAQLAGFAAEQKAARDEVYTMLATLAQASAANAKTVDGLRAEVSSSTAKAFEAFGADLVEHLVPGLVAAMPKAQGAKSAFTPAHLAALAQVVDLAIKQRLAPVLERLDAAERRLPGRDR